MPRLKAASLLIAVAMLASSCSPLFTGRWFNLGDDSHEHRRNFIIFVADGLRPGSLTKELTPNLVRLRDEGVSFPNSHSLFPTFTTANASAIATGHYLGDTGDFANTLYVGYPIFSSGSFSQRAPATMIPFIEHDAVIADIDEHFGGNFLTEESLLALARSAGYQTAAVGKLGPVLLQDATQSQGMAKGLPPDTTIIIDDATGTIDGVPLADHIKQRLAAANLATTAPKRTNGAAPGTTGDNGFGGDSTTPGTTAANVVQQQYFADAVTKVLLPLFRDGSGPFGLVYWSRDPDGSQHNQGDSLGQVVPGINGPTSRAGVHNADANLQQIVAFLEANPELAKNTDLFITSDHGFSTISRHALGVAGEAITGSYAQTLTYRDKNGRQEVPTGFLPPGFLAIDLAHALGLHLFDPDVQITAAGGGKSYKPIDPSLARPTEAVAQRPTGGNAVLGGSGSPTGGGDAQIIVAANGGSDLIYLPSHDANLAKAIVTILAAQDYVSGLFTDDSLGDIPGALPMSAIRLIGTAATPRPQIMVNFRSFATDLAAPTQTQVIIADTTLQQGQGMHGSFGRGDTLNNMIAYGPDFKKGFVDRSPVSNADVAVTLAHALGLTFPRTGQLTGRVLAEALEGGPEAVDAQSVTLRSRPAEGSGMVTILNRQAVGATWYFDAAGFAGRSVGLNP